MAQSIFQFLSTVSSSSCGYCSGISFKSAGMWAHALTVEDYQALTCRNWRRSGCYLYHMCMDKTCCPAYMIKCDALEFKPSKHQKKVIKKFNKYMMTGSVTDSTKSKEEPAATTGQAPKVKPVSTGVGADPNKPKAIKAKELRLQRKQEKLQKQSDDGVLASGSSSAPKHSKEKSLGDLLNEYDITTAKHKFELRLVRSSPESSQFKETLSEEHDIYQKYQMAVHGDSRSKANLSGFRRFLVESPLKETSRNGVGLGSFHYQYVVDDVIIAVEIMDILPDFISSKYFIYDPSYEFLTLGVYSALRSIYLIQQLNETLSSMRGYCMGFYIHSCPKMRYKGSYSASYLLCPETYQWTPIDQCLPLLDANKYSRLCADPQQEDAEKVADDDYNQTSCLIGGERFEYQSVKRRKDKEGNDQNVRVYTSLVGKNLSQNMLLYLT